MPAFGSEDAKLVFWDRFTFYTTKFEFKPIIVTLIPNHYHILGYLKFGENLGPMMRHIHGSVAKLVNDTIVQKLKPFWYDHGRQSYFDGCIRNEKQCRRAYRYTLFQCRRHGICADPEDYSHTRVFVDIERAVKRAHELQAFLEGVPYKRYERRTER